MTNHPHRRALALRMIVAWCLLCVGHAAQAFESDEHQRTSKLAYELTKDYLAQRIDAAAPGQKSTTVSMEARAALEALDANDYGFVVQCVDYMLYPERVFTYGWAPAARTDSDADAPAGPISMPGLPASGKVELPSALKKRCDKEGTTVWIQAAHNNYAHFQQDLFVSLRLWHLLAVQLGKAEKNYVAALVTNAVADHYLQDLFAPGHIVTPRDKLTDLPATATHDLANQMGLVFETHLNEDIWEILGFLCGSKGGADDASIQCDATAAVPMKLTSEAKIVDLDFHTRALLKNKKTLFRGDGHLDEPEQSRQHLLMIAVQMRSILDVLQGLNHTTKLDIRFDLGQGTATAHTPFGSYVVKEGMDDFAKIADLDPPPARVDVLGGARDKFVTSAKPERGGGLVCSLGGCDDKPYILKTRAPIVSFSSQRESQSSGAYMARNLYTIELSTFNSAWDSSGLTRAGAALSRWRLWSLAGPATSKATAAAAGPPTAPPSPSPKPTFRSALMHAG